MSQTPVEDREFNEFSLLTDEEYNVVCEVSITQYNTVAAVCITRCITQYTSLQVCGLSDREDRLLLCDSCDLG